MPSDYEPERMEVEQKMRDIHPWTCHRAWHDLYPQISVNGFIFIEIWSSARQLCPMLRPHGCGSSVLEDWFPLDVIGCWDATILCGSPGLFAGLPERVELPKARAVSCPSPDLDLTTIISLPVQ